MSAPSAAPTTTIGNDVVDLTAPRASGRAAHGRFLERVFTAAERAAIRTARDPDLELWHAWAAKEAAYKVVSKLLAAPPVFAHRTFEVTWQADGPAVADRRHGFVVHGAHTVDVWAEVLRDGGALHVVALGRGAPPAAGLLSTVDRLQRSGAPWAAPLEELRERMSEREREAVHSRSSAAVRVGARGAIATLLNVHPDRIEIVCRPGVIGRRPPMVLVDRVPAPVDVSLSHDGPWIAWSLALHDSSPSSDPTSPDSTHP